MTEAFPGTFRAMSVTLLTSQEPMSPLNAVAKAEHGSFMVRDAADVPRIEVLIERQCCVVEHESP